jgi:hypothetical protein
MNSWKLSEAALPNSQSLVNAGLPVGGRWYIQKWELPLDSKDTGGLSFPYTDII